MKKLNLTLAAVAALSMASCSSDEPAVNASQDGATTFTLTIPANAASRAMGDGQDIVGKVDLNYSVFQIDTSAPTAVGTFVTSDTVTTPFQKDTSGNTYSTTLSLNLAKGQTYNVVFWAANPSAPYTWTANTATVAVDYSAMATNNDLLDAYFGTAASVTPGTAASATLKRPFAQLNLLTSDYDDVFVKKAYGDGLANLTTSVKVKASDINTNLNLFTGVATGNPANDITFTAVASQLKLDANGNVTDGSMTINSTNYAWLTMDYLLVNANQSVADCEWAINANGTQQTTVSVPACPVQRNYQTNVYGALLTNPTDLNVTINPAFDGTEPVQLLAPHKFALNGTIMDDSNFGTAIQSIAENSNPVIELGPNTTFELPSTFGSDKGTVTFKGSAGTVIDAEKNAVNNGNAGVSVFTVGSNVVFENVEVIFNPGENTYCGLYLGDGQFNKTITYKNCVIRGGQWPQSGNKYVFEGCTFYNNSYSFTTYSVAEASFTGCKFYISSATDGAVNFYGKTARERNLTFTDCEFHNSVAQTKVKAAVQLTSNGDGNCAYLSNVTFTNCSQTGFTAATSGSYQVFGGGVCAIKNDNVLPSKYGKYLHLVINGTIDYNWSVGANAPDVDTQGF